MSDPTTPPEARRCPCTLDSELGAGATCPGCGHRDHGRSGCKGLRRLPFPTTPPEARPDLRAEVEAWAHVKGEVEAHAERAANEYRETGYRLDEEDEFAAETQRLFNELVGAEDALRAALARAYQAHPDANHDFRTVCRLCGENGYLNVSLVTDLEAVRIEPR